VSFSLIPSLATFPANSRPTSPVRLYVRSRRSTTKLSLLWALPLEAINFWIVGYPAAPHPLTRASQNAAVALQWYVIHLPGIIAIDHSPYLRLHAALNSVVLFISGYVGTLILLIPILSLASLVRRTLRKLSSPYEANSLKSKVIS
jgi:hypothetical protein